MASGQDILALAEGLQCNGCQPSFRETGVMGENVCEVCHQAIRQEERWFRVREEYVHASCSEKYLKQVLENRKAVSKSVPQK
jgi:hypothetical protein